MKKTYLYIAFFICSISLSISEDYLRLIDYDYSAYPLINNKFFVFDDNGNPILNLNTSNFNIRDNGKDQLDITNLSCNQIEINNSISYTLVFDLGLDNHYHNPTNFSLGKQLTEKLVSLIDTDLSEISLTSYDYRSFLNREFTRVKLDVLSELSAYQPAPGSLFDAALIKEPAGAFKINNRGENDSKSIILITDGGGKFDIQTIQTMLQDSGARLFVISLRKQPVIGLKNLAVSSDGWWFELQNSQDMNPILFSVLAMSKGYVPCEINWNMDYSCFDEHQVEISVPSRSIKDDFLFKLNNLEKSTIINDNSFLAFSSVEVGNKASISLTLTAKNRDILIQELRVKEPFKIVQGNVTNHLLREDDFIRLTIEYTPTHKAIVFSELEILSDACETMPVYMTGGFPNTPPTERTVKIIHPNGGEHLIIGDKSFVNWLGLLPKDVVQLDYSTDNGKSWIVIATNILGLEREWIIPDTPSDSCLVRITQLWPNNLSSTLNLKHKGAVNSAFFDVSGDFVLTASSDTTAAVWVSNTGIKKFDLIGHNKPIHWAVFDPQSKYIATSSYDSLIIIWDFNFGTEINRLKAHTDRITSINFSKSGKYIVSSDYKGFSIVWDRNWNIIKTLRTNPFGPTWYVEFHPINEDIILSASLDGIAKEWDWTNYVAGSAPIKQFPTNSINCTHATYNTDGTKVSATTSSGKPLKLFVWDVSDPVNPIYDISHNFTVDDNNSINFSSFFFHPDLGKEVLLTASTDQTARTWDANDGSPLIISSLMTNNIFIDIDNEHKNVATAVFDRFGTRLLTSSWDSTAKIWNLVEPKILQRDVSDNVFSISYARGKGLAIDMGTVYLGELKDSIIRAVFVNESDFQYNILGYNFTGSEANHFDILTDLVFPYAINAGDSIPLEIRYYPDKTGLSTSEIEFQLPAGIVVKSQITGFCDLSSLAIKSPIVDFDLVEVGDFKDMNFDVILTNESGGPIEIEDISIVGSYKGEFSSNQNISQTIQNGEDIAVTLRFIPDHIGRKNAQYQVSYKGKGSPRKINMFGEGVDSRSDSLMIYVKDAEAFPGDIVRLPIYIGAYGSITTSELVKGFTTNLSFNATLLEPISGFSESELIGDIRTLTIDLPKTFGADSILTVLEFKALWGNDTISPLSLSYTVPQGSGRVLIKEESASFKLKGVCLQNGVLRLFLPGEMSLEQNTPNPANDKTSISFTVLEMGETTIELFDIYGNKVRTLISENLSRGNHTVEIEVNDLPQGTYYYSMKSPSNILRKTMLIVR